MGGPGTDIEAVPAGAVLHIRYDNYYYRQLVIVTESADKSNELDIIIIYNIMSSWLKQKRQLSRFSIRSRIVSKNLLLLI